MKAVGQAENTANLAKHNLSRTEPGSQVQQEQENIIPTRHSFPRLSPKQNAKRTQGKKGLLRIADLFTQHHRRDRLDLRSL